MKKILLAPLLLASVLLLLTRIPLHAQVEPGAGKWKPWFPAAKPNRLTAPSGNKEELQQVIAAQNTLGPEGMKQITYWNAGAPGYRWHTMVSKLWMTDITGNGALAQMLMGTAIYDATIAAWDAKYTFNRQRPFAADNRVKLLGVRPESPSYPCEHSVAAGAAVAIISHFYPALADSAKRMADRAMASRVAAGASYPSDTRAGFELGKVIAQKQIELTRDFITTKKFDGKMPTTPGSWKGTPMLPMAGHNKTFVLDSASQFRPVPPPDFAKEMDELKNFKQTFRSKANAWYFASQPTGDDLLTKKIFEYNLQNNPPRAARVYAAVAITYYDAFTACWDAKYHYWATRPDQYDPTYVPLVPTPPFPGYPSGHAMMCGAVEELFSYFFPYDKAFFQKFAKDGAESRFYAGIHFRSDNEAGLELGRRVAGAVRQRVVADGADVMNVAVGQR
ncbi:MAG TPA: phosphatase PAP2 family protein [Chryseosolibacter sp.]